MKITQDTQLVVSLAGKQNSIGAAMHNAGYEALGVNFVYVPITTGDPKNAISGIRGFNLKGGTVSMPHKQAVMEYLDKVDSVAQTIGAVNTVLNEDGILTGYNSDWVGAMAALKEVTRIENKRVIVIGAGGVARAITYGLKQNGAHTIIYARDREKAKKLADDFDAEFGGTIENLQSAEYDVAINATSIGFGTDESIVNESFFRPNTVVMDVVFVPAETTFMKDAKSRGADVVAGYRMLIHQALFQMELFTGKKAPFDVMERALLDALSG
jgi:shikimate dehydrogenase